MASFWYQNIQNKYQQQKNIPGDPSCPYNRFAPPYSITIKKNVYVIVILLSSFFADVT